MPQLPSGTVTFLFTDVESSTELARALGDAYGETLAEHRRIVREAARTHGGEEVDTQGDSFLIAFPRARDAVAAAIAVQRALAAHPWPEGSEVRARIGIHTGEPALGAEGYAGIDLALGARICAAGHGGQIVVSQATRELLGDEQLADLGDHRLKDFPRAERLFQVVAEGLPRTFPALRTLNTTNLPLQPTPLVGRDDDLRDVADLLLREEVRLLTLTGAGGTGKSRLALEVAAQLADEFDATYFVELAPTRDPELVAAAVAQVLGVRDDGVSPLDDALTRFLGARDALLLLDNFEHLLPAATFVARLLARTPSLKVLVTSRAALRVSGEQEVCLEPLAGDDAVHLFVERARLARHDYEPADDDLAAIAEICARLDGLPLAIELAAAHTKVLTPVALLGRLERRLHLLVEGPRDLPARQQTLRTTLDWSYDLLGEAERALLARLAVFVGGSTLEAAETICGDDDCSDVVRTLALLVEKSLLRSGEDTGGELRFTMLETVREYARERLEEIGVREALERRHCEYFLAFAERAEDELTRGDQTSWLDRLDAEYDNIRAALAWAIDHDPELALRLASALGRFWRARGHVEEARQWLERGLAAGTSAPPALRAKSLWAASRQAMAQSDYEAAKSLLAECYEVANEAGCDREAIFSLSELAFIAQIEDDLDRASEFGERAVALAREKGDDREISGALNSLASVVLARGDYARARPLYLESLALRRKLGDKLLVANSAYNTGEAALEAGDMDIAIPALEESLALARELEDPVHTAAALCCLGEIALLRGNLTEAESLLRESLSLYVELDDSRAAAEALHALGGVAAASGEAERAARLWGAAAVARERVGARVLGGERRITESLFPALVDALGPVAFAELYARGRTLDIDVAAAEATSAR